MLAASQHAPRKQPIRISAIVATHNRAGYLRECLDSILNQTRPPAEVILVDDGSEDDTPRVASDYGSRIVYLRQRNLGKSVALNRGVERAAGTHFWFFDDDDVALPDSLELRIRALEATPAAEFAYSGCLIGVDGPSGRIEPVQRLDIPALDPGDLPLRLLRSFLFHLQSVLVRRDCVERAGGFDARYLRCQDYEFLIRLARVARGVLAAGPSFVLREHGGARGPERLAHGADERLAVWLRFNRMLGEQLASRLSPEEYLLPADRALVTAAREHTALINRLCVMATKGWLVQVAADLGSLSVAAIQHAPLRLSPSQVADCLEAFGHENFRLALSDDGAGTLAALAREPRAPIQRQLAAIVAHALARPRNFVRAMAGERLGLARAAWRLARLAGPAEVARVTIARLGEPTNSSRPRPRRLSRPERAQLRSILGAVHRRS
jgi:glycosyltransferase involved in cell wall biosynthesis